MEEMSTTQLKMNAELFGLLQELSADENLMKKGIKALRRIVSKSKEEDPTLMTKEEYFAMLDRAEEQNPHAKPYQMHLKVSNKYMSGRKLSEISEFLKRDIVCTRLMHDGHVTIPHRDTIFNLGDEVLIVCAEADAEAMALFDKANAVLGFDLKKICFEGPAEELTKSNVCQPAIFVTSYAAYRAFQKKRPTSFACAAGLSLGEWGALCAAAQSTQPSRLHTISTSAALRCTTRVNFHHPFLQNDFSMPAFTQILSLPFSC